MSTSCRDYLLGLLSFYSKLNLNRRVLTKVEKVEDSIYRFKVNDELHMLNLNLGFEAKSACWISRSLMNKNIKVIESALDPSLDIYLCSVIFKGNKCRIYLFDNEGNIVLSNKIKFTTINWFRIVRGN